MISINEFKKQLKTPLRQATLCFLVRDGEILLAMKKRGFGQGKWNGVGGKPERNESIKEAAIREAQEEIGVTPTNLDLVATLDFYFADQSLDKDWNQQVVVYMVDSWEGDPRETEEMKPQWFSKDLIPFKEMWVDDKYWLPRILNGERVKAEFMFGKDSQIVEYRVEEL